MLSIKRLFVNEMTEHFCWLFPHPRNRGFLCYLNTKAHLTDKRFLRLTINIRIKMYVYICVFISGCSEESSEVAKRIQSEKIYLYPARPLDAVVFRFSLGAAVNDPEEK
jgi:hypothetical protein